MPSILQGNIFDFFSSETQPCLLVHQANCFHTMGAGIAKEIRTRFPAAYKADLNTPYGASSKLGTFSYATVQNDPAKTIINLYGQHRYGRDKQHTDYAAQTAGFLALKAFALSLSPNPIIYFPYKFGCNLAGGDWGIVYNLISNSFADYTSPVNIVQLPS
jgi:O-acetyl-ADP-ribose deacetylase (regulator of RNase III)